MGAGQDSTPLEVHSFGCFSLCPLKAERSPWCFHYLLRLLLSQEYIRNKVYLPHLVNSCFPGRSSEPFSISPFRRIRGVLQGHCVGSVLSGVWFNRFCTWAATLDHPALVRSGTQQFFNPVLKSLSSPRYKRDWSYASIARGFHSCSLLPLLPSPFLRKKKGMLQ